MLYVVNLHFCFAVLQSFWSKSIKLTDTSRRMLANISLSLVTQVKRALTIECVNRHRSQHSKISTEMQNANNYFLSLAVSNCFELLQN